MADISLTDFAKELNVSKQKISYHLKKDEDGLYSYKGEKQIFITEEGQKFLRGKLTVSVDSGKKSQKRDKKKSSTKEKNGNILDGKIMEEIKAINESFKSLSDSYGNLTEEARKRETRLLQEIDEWKAKYNDCKVENHQLEAMNAEWVEAYEKLEEKYIAETSKGFFKKKK